MVDEFDCFVFWISDDDRIYDSCNAEGQFEISFPSFTCFLFFLFRILIPCVFLFKIYCVSVCFVVFCFPRNVIKEGGVL
jgi:hypothetical protein